MVSSMVRTNGAAADACEGLDVRALTDVTGYGLLGHGLEMAEASGVRLEIDATAVPLLRGARKAAAAGAIPGGLLANMSWVEGKVEMDGVDQVTAQLLCDPQTSGGLLAAIAPADVGTFVDRCAKRGVAAAVVGTAVPGAPGTALVRAGRR